MILEVPRYRHTKLDSYGMGWGGEVGVRGAGDDGKVLIRRTVGLSDIR